MFRIKPDYHHTVEMAGASNTARALSSSLISTQRTPPTSHLLNPLHRVCVCVCVCVSPAGSTAAGGVGLDMDTDRSEIWRSNFHRSIS